MCKVPGVGMSITAGVQWGWGMLRQEEYELHRHQILQGSLGSDKDFYFIAMQSKSFERCKAEELSDQI